MKYLLKVSNRNTGKRCEICWKLTKKTPERRHWHRSGVFIVNLEDIYIFTYSFLAFFVVFHQKMCFYHFHFYFWWSTKFLPNNINQSETGIGDKKLAVELHVPRFFANVCSKSTVKTWEQCVYLYICFWKELAPFGCRRFLKKNTSWEKIEFWICFLTRNDEMCLLFCNSTTLEHKTLPVVTRYFIGNFCKNFRRNFFPKTAHGDEEIQNLKMLVTAKGITKNYEEINCLKLDINPF